VNRVYIKFSSVTHALRAKEMIEQYGGKANIRKNPHPKPGEGCGYGIIIYNDAEKYINIIKLNKIRYIGIEYL
jgi:hypothetical protein